MTKSSSNPTSKPVISLSNVTKAYKTGQTVFKALDSISVKIYPGEFVSITGPSGSGKSTLMHIIGLLDRPTSGQVYIDGQNTQQLNQNQLAKLRNQKIGFVFQQFNLLAKTSSLENVALPLLYSDIPRRQHHQLAQNYLKQVGLADKLQNTPAQLSGGQQQRVAIARALVNQPSLILADEPTGNLDTKSGQEIVALLQQLHRQGNTIIIVTHDLSLASQAKRIIKIIDGKIQ